MATKTKKKAMKISLTDARKMFTACEFESAAGWDAKKCAQKIPQLVQVLTTEPTVLTKKVKDPEAKKMLKKLMEAVENGTEIEVTDGKKGSGTFTPKAGKGKDKKKGGSKKSKEEDDEEEEDDDDESDEDDSDDDDDESDEDDEDEDSDDEEEEDDEVEDKKKGKKTKATAEKKSGGKKVERHPWGYAKGTTAYNVAKVLEKMSKSMSAKAIFKKAGLEAPRHGMLRGLVARGALKFKDGKYEVIKGAKVKDRGKSIVPKGKKAKLAAKEEKKGKKDKGKKVDKKETKPKKKVKK